MNKPSLSTICSFFLALTLLLTAPLLAATPSKSTGSSKDACLQCHEPFDSLISLTSSYLMQDGDKQVKSSPHRYVPHKSKEVPECTECHKPHPVPLISKEGLPKANADWCYLCHHTGDLQCGTCHR